MYLPMQPSCLARRHKAKNKAARIINSERDEFGSRKPIAVLAANNPIIILDEPQKMGNLKTELASTKAELAVAKERIKELEETDDDTSCRPTWNFV